MNDYDALLKKRFPAMATTQPLTQHLPAAEAAHLQLEQPVYCDAAGELWFTDPLAPPLLETLASAAKATTHLVNERVLYVHRTTKPDGSPDIQLITGPLDNPVWHVGARTMPIADAKELNWREAISWNGQIVVPAIDGVVCMSADQTIQPQRVRFDAAERTSVRLVVDNRGVLAWQACDDPSATASGVARYVDGQWQKLDGWPHNLVQLIPLLDGGVLTLSFDDDKQATLKTNYLDVASVDESHIEALIDQLSDPSAEVRESATTELARWGASAWPILEKVQADQTPEAQTRIGRLLENRTHPDLLGFRLLPGPVRVLARHGTALMLAAQQGVTFQREADSAPMKVSPAVLLIDSRGVQLAPQALAEAALQSSNAVDVCGNEWFVTSPDLGPRWWVSNHFSDPLLRKPERTMMRVAGLDNAGRLLLRRNLKDATPTLLIDPSLPDQTPRLPVWVRVVENGSTGWTNDNWPVIRSGGAWALTEDHWKPIDAKQMLTDAPPAPASSPSSRPSLLLTDSHGTKYYAEGNDVGIVTQSGHNVKWAIDRALADTTPQLFESSGQLFAVGDPGQLLRYTPPSDQQPLPKLTATFTRRLPTSKPRRVWIDPAGRIDFVYDDNGLAICFPSGRIPPNFAEMMTAEDLRQANEAAEPTTQP